MVLELTSVESRTNSLSTLFGYSSFSSWLDTTFFLSEDSSLESSAWHSGWEVRSYRLCLTLIPSVIREGNELWVMVSCYLALFLAFVKRKVASKHSSPLLVAFFAFLVVVLVEQSELLLLAFSRYVTSNSTQVFGFIVLSEFCHTGTNPSQKILLITR